MKDPQIKKLIEAEKKRQKKVVNLIASENYVSKDVLEALGSELTNKYAEGYPARRYYGGNEIIDKVEAFARNAHWSFSSWRAPNGTSTSSPCPVRRPIWPYIPHSCRPAAR